MALVGSLGNTYPALFAAVTAGTTLLSPYTTGLFTASRVVWGFAYGRPLVTVGPGVIVAGIAASLVAVCALAWLVRRRIRAAPSMTSYRGR